MAQTSSYTPPWQTLPPTPELPPSCQEGYAKVNNIALWYGLYGPPLDDHAGHPVVLLHGGRISSRWYGHLIRQLESTFSVIAIDTRAHGRSSDDLTTPLSYDQFASDAIALLDFLRVPKASFIGWSDGACTALRIAMRYPSRVDRVFPFGANYNPNQANYTGLGAVPFAADLLTRERTQYAALNPDPDWDRFNGRVAAMQKVSPLWDQEDFSQIPNLADDINAPWVLIAFGDHEEAIIREAFYGLHDMIPNSQLILLPGVSHFGPLQDPEGFGNAIKSFLKKPRPSQITMTTEGN